MLRPVRERLLYSPDREQIRVHSCIAIAVCVCEYLCSQFVIYWLLFNTLSCEQSSDKVSGWRSQCAYLSREIVL
jgi:hypothetical protein